MQYYAVYAVMQQLLSSTDVTTTISMHYAVHAVMQLVQYELSELLELS